MKKNKTRARAAAYVALVCVAVVALNILASALVDRFSLKLDMTASGLYQISAQSLEILKGVDTPIDIYCVNSDRESVKEFSELLTRYDNASDFVTVTYIDPYTDPDFVEKLVSEGEDVGLNTIIVQSGDRRRVFRMADMYRFSADGSELVYFDAESRITSAIVNVTAGEAVKLGVAMGHAEAMPAELQSLAVRNNFDIRSLTLDEEIGEDFGILLILAPKTDYTVEEIAVLDRFLARGGSLAVFTDPSVTGLDNLEGFLSEWGLVFQDDVIFDAMNNTDSNPMNVVGYFVEHDITQYFMKNQYYVSSPATRSVTLSPETAVGENMLAPVLATSDDAYAREMPTEQRTTERLPEDIAGPFLMAATSMRQTMAANGEITSRVFAMGSKRVYSDELLVQASVGNARFMANILNWCNADAGVSVSIPPKQVGGGKLALQPWMAYVLGALLAVALPAVIVAFGVRVHLRRRHL